MTVEVQFEGFESRPASAEPSDVGAANQSRLADVEKASALAFETFRLRLFSLEASRSSFDADPLFQTYPGVSLTLSIAGVEEPYSFDVILDDRLFAQLVGVYSTFGWSAIEQFRTVATIRFSPVAGASPQPAVFESEISGDAVDYVQSCLQLLDNLIYDALVYLEQVLKTSAITALTRVNGLANEGYKRLRLERRGTLERPRYAFSTEDNDLAARIHYALTTFAKHYRAMLNAIERQAALRKSLAFDKDRLEGIRAEIVLLAIASDAPLPEVDVDELKKQIADAEKELKVFEAVEKSSSAVTRDVAHVMLAQIPAALPVCLLVAPGDGPSAVANRLGQFYRALSVRADKLQAAIPRESFYVHRLARRPVYRNPKVVENIAFSLPVEGIENLVARTAIAQRDVDVDAQVLSDVDALSDLLGTDLVPFGSVEHMVAIQYMLVLEGRLADIQQAKDASRADDVAGSRLSATLSLLTLVPGLQAIGAIATVIDVLLLARFVVKSADLLGELELEADQKVLSMSKSSFGALSEVATLVDSRRQLASQLQIEAVKQLATLGLAQIRYVRGALAARSYYGDLETLLAAPR